MPYDILFFQFDFKDFPEFFSDEESWALYLCVLFICRLCFVVVQFYVLSFSKGNVIDFGHQSFVGFSEQTPSRWFPQPACVRKKLLSFYSFIFSKSPAKTKTNTVLSWPLGKVCVTKYPWMSFQSCLGLLHQMGAQVLSYLLAINALNRTDDVNLIWTRK